MAINSIQLGSFQAFVHSVPEINKIYAWALRTKIFATLGVLGTAIAGALVITGFKLSLAVMVMSAALAVFAAAISDRAQIYADAQLLYRYAQWIQNKHGGAIPDAFINERIADVLQVYRSPFPPNLAKDLFSNENADFLRLSLQRHKEIEALFGKIHHRAASNHFESMKAVAEGCLKLVNAEELRALKKQLEQEVGAEFAKLILEDWTIIGTDIHDNRAILSTNRKQAILEKARKAKAAEPIVREAIAKMQKDLSVGMPLLVQEYLKDVEVVPAHVQKVIDQMRAKEMVMKELRSRDRFISPKIELDVLESLGFNIKDAETHHLKCRRIEILLQEILANDDIPAVQSLKARLTDLICTIRLEVAGVPVHEMPQVKKAVIEAAAFRKAHMPQAIGIEEEFSQTLPVHLPKARAFLQAWHQRETRRVITDAYKELLKEHKVQILSGEKTLLDFPLDLMPKFRGRTPNLDQAIQWFIDYQDMFVIEFIQGEEDAGECLGDGVCAALTFRAAKNTLFLPDAEPSELQLDKILPQDRVLQAAYIIGHDVGIRLPPEVVARHHVEERHLFMATKENMVVAIADQMRKLAKSNGGLQLGCGGHATFMRMDPIRHKYRFSEPNFGTMVFNRQKEEAPEDLALRMAVCYARLYQWAYPEHTILFGSQVVPLEHGMQPSKEFVIESLKIYD